jgi:LuxR family maltose regulon positive regulatory protein
MQAFYSINIGNFAAASTQADIGKRLSRLAQAPFSGAYAYALAGVAAFIRGDVDGALREYAAGYELAHSERGSYALAVVASCYAEAMYYRGAFAEAQSLLDDALPLIQQTCIADSLAVAHVTFAKLLRLDRDFERAERVLDAAERIAFDSRLEKIARVVAWERVRECIAGKDIQGAQAIAARLGDAAAGRAGAALQGHAEVLGGAGLGYVRLLIATGDAAAALPIIDDLLCTALASGRRLRWIKLQTLRALALFALERMRAARADFVEAIQAADRIGCLRLLAEEPGVTELFDHIAAQQTAGQAALLRRLHAALGEAVIERQAAAAAPIEALSERELEILEMLVEGYSNKRIGAALFISANTVKYHLKNIYGKLGVGNRTQASMAARALPQLLDR